MTGCGSKSTDAAGSGAASSKPSAAGSGAAGVAAAAKEAPHCPDAKAKVFDDGGFCITLPEGFTPKPPEKDGAWTHFQFNADGWNEVIVKKLTVPRADSFDVTKQLLFGEAAKKDKVIEDGPTSDGKGHVLITESEPNRWIRILTRSNKNIYQCGAWTSTTKGKPGQIDICKTLVPLDL